MSCWMSSSRVQTTLTGPSTTAETAAQHVVMRRHLGERKTGGICSIFLYPREHLRAGPHLAPFSRDADRAIERLHRRMRQKRQLVFGIDPFTLGQALGDVAERFCDHAVFFAGRAQMVPNVAGIYFCVRAFVPFDDKRIEPFF